MKYILCSILEEESSIVVDAISEFYNHRCCDDIILENWDNYLKKQIGHVEKTIAGGSVPVILEVEWEERLNDLRAYKRELNNYIKNVK